MGLAVDLGELTQRVVGMAERLGYGLASGVFIRGTYGSSTALVRPFGNPPAGFLESSLSLDEGLRDPLLGRLLAVPGHVVYDQALYVSAGAADMWDCQAEYGYRTGLSISLHASSHEEAFLFGVDGPQKAPADLGRRLQLQGAIQMIALHARAAVQRLVADDVEAVPATVQLSSAERRDLQQAAHAVYARRGSLVEVVNTASPELRSAVQKVHGRSLSGAVLSAIDGGLIQR